jgi:ATP-dependent Clp protease protease subunit
MASSARAMRGSAFGRTSFAIAEGRSPARRYCAAAKKNRIALPNTRFLLHQPRGGAQGRADDVEIEATQILRMRDRLNRRFAEATGQPVERIVADTARNHWMSAEEARAYGLVDRIVEHAADVAP